MDPDAELDARTIVNEWPEARIAEILRNHGDERSARSIARQIVARRPLETTSELVEAVRAGLPPKARFGRGNPAKRTFQAIRIAVNGELEAIDAGLPLAWDAARSGRPPRRDLLPLARGPARQALPRRPRPRLHLPARVPRLPLRARAGGRADHQGRRRPERRRGRRQPALLLRPPARRPQARRPRSGVLMGAPAARPRAARPATAPRREPRAAPATRRPRSARGGAAGRRSGQDRRRGQRHRRQRPRPLADPRPGLDRASSACLLGGIVAVNVYGLGLSAGGSETAAARSTSCSAQQRPAQPDRAAASSERIEEAATALGLAVPAPDAVTYLDALRGGRRPRRRAPRQRPDRPRAASAVRSEPRPSETGRRAGRAATGRRPVPTDPAAVDPAAAAIDPVTGLPVAATP